MSKEETMVEVPESEETRVAQKALWRALYDAGLPTSMAKSIEGLIEAKIADAVEFATAQKCTSWLGHRFEPRYSVVEPVSISGRDMGKLTPEMIAASAGRRTYEGDVCARCGAVVNKKEVAHG